MTAVTIQSNKIVLNEFKDNQALLEPLYGKNQTNFLANPVKFYVCKSHCHSIGEKKLFLLWFLTENSFVISVLKCFHLNNVSCIYFYSFWSWYCLQCISTIMGRMKDNLELHPWAKYIVFIICNLFQFYFICICNFSSMTIMVWV